MAENFIPFNNQFLDTGVTRGGPMPLGITYSSRIIISYQIPGTNTRQVGFSFVGGFNTGYTVGDIEPSSGITNTNGYDLIQGTWRPETFDPDPCKDYWLHNPYRTGIPWQNLWVYIEDVSFDNGGSDGNITGPRADPTYAGSSTLSWTPGGSAFSTWINLDGQFTWSREFQTAGTQAGGSGDPLYWHARLGVYVQESASQPSGTGSATNLGEVELQLWNSV